MSKIFLCILILGLTISNTFCEKQKKSKNPHRSLVPNPLFNSSTLNTKTLKFHSKLLQTVYSDSFSKNYYYTTLYVGHNRVKQTYIIDTTSSIMASPCAPCEECGKHKNPVYYDLDHLHKPLKCKSKICHLTSANSCKNKKLKFLSNAQCSFKSRRAGGDGIMGYFMNDIVYFETDKKTNLPLYRKLYRSYAIPVGCTTAESGEYKELRTDGIIGMNNDPKGFMSILYNLKVVNRNIFTLCFSLRGGYMSLGEVENTYHKSTNIEYIPLLDSNIYYLVKLNSIKVGSNSSNILKNPVIASIDTGNSISYFPSNIFKSFLKQFKSFCGDKCGNLTYIDELGYCAPFQDRESLFKSIYQYWPNITLNFGESEYIWKPINYYYYHLNYSDRKACLGIDYHSDDKVILGSNFIHNHDIIFDRQKQRLGFVEADCSRGNLIINRWAGILGDRYPIFENTDPVLMDKNLHHGELEKRFIFGDINHDDTVDFIEGHNTELDRKDLSTLNYIIFITSIIIVTIVIVLIFSVLFCNKKKLTYEQQENEYTSDEIPNDNNEDNTNKISFEENNPPESNVEDK